MTTFVLSSAPPKSPHKFVVQVQSPDGSLRRNILFGARGYSDFTIHKDVERVHRYLRRHGARNLVSPSHDYTELLHVQTSDREDWRNPETKGWWSRWLLWSVPDLAGAIRWVRKLLSVHNVTLKVQL